MSPLRLDAILAQRTLSPSKKLLLIVLAQHERSDSPGVYPSLRRLQQLSSLSLAHVCTLLAELATEGYLTIHHRQGPKGGNLYVLHLPSAPVSGAPSRRAPLTGTRTAGAPVSGTELRTEEEKTVLVQSAEHQPVVLQSVEQQATADERGLAWLRSFEHELDPKYAQALKGDAPPAPQPALRAVPPRGQQAPPGDGRRGWGERQRARWRQAREG